LKSIFIGFDPRETSAFAVCRTAIRRHLNQIIPVRGIVLEGLMKDDLYWRKTEVRKSAVDRPILWDCISDAPMSTEFAISRFLTPHLARRESYKTTHHGWALFMDCDMLPLVNFGRLFDELDDNYALMCVKHQHAPTAGTKMDGQLQTVYARKNWSSFMAFNCDHPANDKLTVELINSVPGRDLHRFCWLEDDEIGELQPGWNWLVGEQPEPMPLKNIHFTQGGPWFPGYEDVPYADEWREEFHRWAS